MKFFRICAALVIFSHPGVADAADDWTGIWRDGLCENGTDSWVIGPDMEIIINQSSFATNPITISHIPVDPPWHSLMTSAGDRFFLRRTSAGDLVFYDLKPVYFDRFVDDVNGGRLVPSQQPDIWAETLYQRCPVLPQPSRLLFGELSGIMLALTPAAMQCQQADTAEACMAAIVSALDLGGDDALNRAELARALRAATLYATGLGEDWVDLSDAAAGQLATLPVAPVVASILLGSFDYNGDGALDGDEISADRLTLTAANGLTDSMPSQSDLALAIDGQMRALLPLIQQFAAQ